MEHLLTTESLISFFILVVLEIVLGIDNVIFVSIIINRLKDKADGKKARLMWMILGIISRSILLLGLSWLLSQKGKPVITVMHKGFDLASIVMLLGGLFLIYKSIKEIHNKLEGEDEHSLMKNGRGLSLKNAVIEIFLIDTVFSFDSVLTAGGTAKHVEIMIAAVIIAMIMMFLFSAPISSFIHTHPTIKMLALSFLVMIGLSLVIEGWDSDGVENLNLKNYIYFGMAFSFGVEVLNMVMTKRMKKREAMKLEDPEFTQNSNN